MRRENLAQRSEIVGVEIAVRGQFRQMSALHRLIEMTVRERVESTENEVVESAEGEHTKEPSGCRAIADWH